MKRMTKNILLFISLVLMMSGMVEAQSCPRYIGGDSSKTTAPYSIYREFFKKGLYTDAFPSWKNVYNNAPGFRKQTFLDGEVMYADIIQKTKDDAQRQKYIDTLFMIYNKQIQCHGEDEYVLGRRAIDLLKYGKDADIPQARQDLERTIQLSGDNAYPY